MPERPRYYQTDCVDAVVDLFAAGENLLLVVQPTGTGKSVIFSILPAAIKLPRDKRYFVWVDRDVLVEQNAATLAEWNPGRKVGIERGEDWANDDCDLIVGSVQTLDKKSNALGGKRRIERFRPEQYLAVSIDEGHMAVSPSYRHCLEHMRLAKGKQVDKERLLLLLTATPNRADNLGMENVVDKIAYSKPIDEFMEEGFLVRSLRVIKVETNVDLTEVRKAKKGDYNLDDLAKVCNTSLRNRLIVQKHQQFVPPNASFVVFTVDVEHSQMQAKEFRKAGLSCEAIWGEMPKGKRRELLAEHKRGNLLGLTSCQALSVGWDSPVCWVGHMGRPTASGLLYQQQMGRILRPCPSPEALREMISRGIRPQFVKRKAVAFDYVDNSRHQLMTVPSIFGLRADFDFNGEDVIDSVKEIEEIQVKHRQILLSDITDMSMLRASVMEVDPLAPPILSEEIRRYSKYPWQIGAKVGVYTLRLFDPGKSISVREGTLGEWEIRLHAAGGVAVVDRSGNLRDALRIAESKIPERDQRHLKQSASWRKEGGTDNQAWLLWREDQRIRERFPQYREFQKYAAKRYTKGDLSLMINAAKAAQVRA